MMKFIDRDAVRIALIIIASIAFCLLMSRCTSAEETWVEKRRREYVVVSIDTLAICRDSAIVAIIKQQRSDKYGLWRIRDTLIVKRYTPPPPPPTDKERLADYISRKRPQSIYWLDAELDSGVDEDDIKKLCSSAHSWYPWVKDMESLREQ